MIHKLGSKRSNSAGLQVSQIHNKVLSSRGDLFKKKDDDDASSGTWSPSCSLDSETSPNVFPPYNSTVRSLKESQKRDFFSHRLAIALRRKTRRANTKAGGPQNNSEPGENVAPIFVTRKLSARLPRGNKELVPLPPPPIGGPSPTVAVRKRTGRYTTNPGTQSEVQDDHSLQDSVRSNYSDDIREGRDRDETSAKKTGKRQVHFQQRVQFRVVRPLDELTDEPGDLWYQAHEYRAIHAKINRIAARVRTEGNRRKMGQKKVTCIRGLERIIDYEKTLAARAQSLECMVDLQCLGASADALAMALHDSNRDCLLEAIARARVDELEARAYYNKKMLTCHMM